MINLEAVEKAEKERRNAIRAKETASRRRRETETMKRDREWRETAANINALPVEERKRLGAYLLAKHGAKMIPSLKDRIEGLAAGQKIDHSAIPLLEQMGVEL
jgi:hypothetical protein